MAKEKLEKTNAMRILDQKKVAYKEHTLGITDAVSGVEAASLLGVDESLVFKTLVTVGKSLEHYVFVIPVACELDLKKGGGWRKRKERRNGQIERPSCTHRLRARRLLPDRNEKVFQDDD